MNGPYSVGDEPVPGYRLVKFLGRGGFGEVWQARTPGRAECALKFIRLLDKQGYKEFRAIRLVKLLRHPHLVPIQAFWLKEDNGKILDDCPDEDSVWLRDKDVELIIAMGLGDKNLYDRLRECRAEGKEGIPVEELLEYMTAAAKAIDFLNQPTHDLGTGPIAIQHCDIKPQNILIVGGEVQVCDFGLARPLNEARRTSTAAGSYAYIAPELIDCKPSRSCDQYSLAISYVELRTGKLPFGSESLYQVMMAHMRGQLDFSRLPPAEQEVLRRATALDPNGRYRTTLEMVKALRRAVEGTSPSRPSGSSGTPRVPGVWQAGEYVGLGYRLVRPLGRGGYGEVWEATAPGGIPVAVKIISNVEAHKGKQEFEALELIKNVKHNHVIELHAYWLLDAQDQVILGDSQRPAEGGADCKLIIATKLADKNLLQRLQECQRTSGNDQGIPFEELLGYMHQAAQALDYLNTPQYLLGSRQVSIQHCGIKPQNILLAGGMVKVGDFGLAKVLEGTSAVIRSQSAGLTLAYAAPESFDGQVTAWSDQYALAITYFHLRTGRMPFSATSYTGIIRVHSEGKLDLSLLPDGERGVIARATSLQPKDRFPSCQAMVDALENVRPVGKKAGVSAPSVAPVPAPPEAKKTPPGAYAPTPPGPRTPTPPPWRANESSPKEKSSGIPPVTASDVPAGAKLEKNTPAADPYTTLSSATPPLVPEREILAETQAGGAPGSKTDPPVLAGPHSPALDPAASEEQEDTGPRPTSPTEPHHLTSGQQAGGSPAVAVIAKAAEYHKSTVIANVALPRKRVIPIRWRRVLLGVLVALAALGIGGIIGWIHIAPRPIGYVVLGDLKPLELKNGESGKLAISIERHDFTEPVELTLDHVPEAVAVPGTVTIPKDHNRIELEVAAQKQAAPVTTKIKVAAAKGRASKAFDLTVIHWRPDWRMVAGATVRTIDGKNYYGAIDVVKDDMPIRFLLIPKGEDKETFYIMENKVSVEQFEKFASLNRQLIKSDEWTKGAVAGEKDLNNADKQHPVMRVHVEDAENFAHWLGGDLPMPSEWDKAAGRFESNRGEGPFQGAWDPSDKTAIAVGRDREGPMEVGKATKDISLFGCRDMAGNGREWTRKLFADPNERTVPIEKPKSSEKVILRGRSYLKPEPLRFRDVEELRGIEAQHYTRPDPTIGFRVVLDGL